MYICSFMLSVVLLNQEQYTESLKLQQCNSTYVLNISGSLGIVACWTNKNMKVTDERKKDKNKQFTYLIPWARFYMNAFPVCSDVTNDMLSLMTSSGPEVDCSL